MSKGEADLTFPWQASGCVGQPATRSAREPPVFVSRLAISIVIDLGTRSGVRAQQASGTVALLPGLIT
jgi:hypothetical protein